jgi:hypothetical protein
MNKRNDLTDGRSDKETMLDEIRYLAGHVCNQSVTPAETQRLEALLLGNAEAQRCYQEYMLVHAELYWLNDSVLDAHSGSESATSIPLTEHQNRWTGNLGWIAGLAMTLVLGITAGNFFASGKPGDAPGSDLLVHSDESENPALGKLETKPEVARVTGLLNCRWQTDLDGNNPIVPIGFGSSLVANQKLHLLDGVAEITFASGARMILQAPAEVEISSGEESILHLGRLTATCPPGAEGFRINTEGLELIDLGTEFGVLADSNGNTEVHVFQGLVEGRFREAVDGAIRTMQWTTNQTVRFDREKSEVQPLDKSSSQFVRSLSSSLGPVSGMLAGEDFDYPLGRWGGQNGGFGWGGPWEDIYIEQDDTMTNAIVPGSLRFGIMSSSGNHAALTGDFNRIRRNLSTSISGVFDTAGFVEDQDGARLIGRSGTTLYISFLQQIDRLDQAFYGFELNRGDGNRNRVVCIGHGAARSWNVDQSPNREAGETGWAVTSEFNGNNNLLLELGNLGPETTDVTLLVAKISFGDNNRDIIEVFKNPTSLWDESQCHPDVVGEGNFAFDRIGFANFIGDKIFEVDNIRIGTTFSGVTRPFLRQEPALEHTRQDVSAE